MHLEGKTAVGLAAAVQGITQAGVEVDTAVETRAQTPIQTVKEGAAAGHTTSTAHHMQPRSIPHGTHQCMAPRLQTSPAATRLATDS